MPNDISGVKEIICRVCMCGDMRCAKRTGNTCNILMTALKQIEELQLKSEIALIDDVMGYFGAGTYPKELLRKHRRIRSELLNQPTKPI